MLSYLSGVNLVRCLCIDSYEERIEVMLFKEDFVQSRGRLISATNAVIRTAKGEFAHEHMGRTPNYCWAMYIGNSCAMEMGKAGVSEMACTWLYNQPTNQRVYL